MLFSANPQTTASEKVPAVQGFRNAYVQKYAPNAAATAQADTSSGGRAGIGRLAGRRTT